MMSKIEHKLEEFANRIPAQGMYISYLYKAEELMSLYVQASSIMEDEKTPENEEMLKEILEKIESIVG